ncbi:phosphate ABC transporter substrate-binding protein PstS [Acetobacter sp. TBRC 12305]|uniref:Phosphate-binding protein PstS n=2 Tax=Acetobacter garciniae TaxID=2817435 RepID=A0A939HN56_9PROT|nr:phosphate ABC transporter substrate-binding protein PstS [Acetobacter garciniae]MBO1324016.1 phosphate ABC transporter substrate-binding protein PstS [Acetobacter garciniae]MBX0343705.1 phosphate ABC transporter substrate-binding protein PstS [Acetobacter garciniae]
MEHTHRTTGGGRAKAWLATVLCTLAVALPGLGRADDDTSGVDVTGAGSSFAAPLYEGWSAQAAGKIGVHVNYQSIGSGAGQNQVLAGTVDFGASDAPMAHDRLVAGRLVQFPTAIGGVVITANVPGVSGSALRLTGPILADIFAGTITQWNDPRIAQVNPGLALPDMPIAPLHRADGSGTTYVFTDYLSRVSPQWHDAVGQGTSVAWPGGAGARGNDGIAAYVANTAGSIGYVEYAYAVRNHLAMVQLRNRAGMFVAPTVTSFVRAAEAAHWDPTDMTASLCDTDGAESWPIVTTTYVLLPAQASAANKGQAARQFFRWGMTQGDGVSRALDYVPLPATVRDSVLQKLGGE